MWLLCEPSSLGSRLPSQTNSWQCLMRASQVENGLLSIILQTWHDLDLSQLWRQGCHKSKYLTHQTQNLKNLWAKKNSDIFQYFPCLLSRFLSSFVTTNILCKYNLKKFPFQSFSISTKCTIDKVSCFNVGSANVNKILHGLQMLSSVTLNCQVTKIIVNSWS